MDVLPRYDLHIERCSLEPRAICRPVYAMFSIFVFHTDSGLGWSISRRGSEIKRFRQGLKKKYLKLPKYPPRNFFNTSSPPYWEKRREKLEIFLRGILQMEGVNQSAASRTFFGFPANSDEESTGSLTYSSDGDFDLTILDFMSTAANSDATSESSHD